MPAAICCTSTAPIATQSSCDDSRMLNRMIVASLVAVLSLVAGCKSEREKCVDRGVYYYKEIGSFPRLSDGRDAEQVAKERCERSNNVAFPEPE